MKIIPTTQPLHWLRDRNVDKSLILKPPYQRKPVWTINQQTYLIDSILKDFQIPEIYIHRVTNAQGITIYNIVDGQQRIRAILDFIKGEFSLSEKYTPEYADFDFDDLPDSVKQVFWSFTIYIREITGASEEDVRNLFRRMNKNVVALNAQELRHATYSGFFIKLMEEISEEDFWAENKIVTTNEIRRMKDVEFISTLFISMMNGIQDKTKEVDNYYQSYEESFSDKDILKNKFQSIEQTIIELLPNIKDTRWRNKSDFYTLFMVLSNIKDEKKYIPKKDYKKVQKELERFSEEVSLATQKGVTKKISKEVRDYANAVTKSTTDKDRRIIRHRIIYKKLSRYSKK